MSEPVHAEWASGRRKLSLSMLLLWFGGASVVASLIIGLQIWAVPSMGKGLPKAMWLIPAWGTVAILLALTNRRASGQVSTILGATWLLIALLFCGWLKLTQGQ